MAVLISTGRRAGERRGAAFHALLRRWGPAAWPWVMVFVSGAALAAPAPPAGRAPEYAVKAAYLYNFTHFVEWPGHVFATAEAPMVIGVLGEDPFGPVLDQAITNKSAQGRSLEVRRLKQPAEMEGCHILFVCASEARRLPEVLEAAHRKNILTVSDLDRFAELGGVISLFTENNKVRFRINLSAAERAGTRISSQLLRLGPIIREKETAGR